LLRAAALSILLGVVSGCARHRLYWGDVHGHTSQSDGKGTVPEYFTHARDIAGLDFVMVTDHDFGSRPPWQLGPQTWRRIQDSADGFTENDKFVAIAGYEWTSQPKYWTGYQGDEQSERLFPGRPRYYNHKIVYCLERIPFLFNAKNPAYATPDLLANAVRPRGGLIHNAHPYATIDGRDQWVYAASNASVIANTEIGPDQLWHENKSYKVSTETSVRAYLDAGGRTGFVAGSDTHTGKAQARTAVYAAELSRPGLFEALGSRRCYAVIGARIKVDFRVNGCWLGQEIRSKGPPRLWVKVAAPSPVRELIVIRNGVVLRQFQPAKRRVCLQFSDAAFPDSAYYYVRVTLDDRDEHGNSSAAWSSPVWVSRR
jgi:hypothetical protein